MDKIQDWYYYRKGGNWTEGIRYAPQREHVKIYTNLTVWEALKVF